MSLVIVIYGPTAVGKSGVAIELAKKINGEIISADSMQIYKGLDIGSAKVTNEEMEGIRHHLINIKEPDENYSVAEFCDDANMAIDEILSKNKTPIIVGGTGLYIKGLIEGYNFGNAKKNEKFRAELENLSNEDIYSMLCEKNPNVKIDKNNRHRLIRALERAEFGDDVSSNGFKQDYLMFGICDDRQNIYERINHRVDVMVKMGLLNEVKYLISLNLKDNALCMKAIGYKELIPYVNGEDSLENCLEDLKRKSRNYAKRQFTFMNQFKNIIKINYEGKRQTAEEIIKYIKKR